jgi:hypothetical protein
VARVLLGFLFFCSISLGQSQVLRIRVLEGDGAVRAPGSRGNHLVLEVADEVGRPVSQATVGLQLPDDGPSGTFASGLRTEIALTDAQGRASVRGFRVNSLAGPFDIRITAARQGSRAGMLSRQYIAGSGGSGSGSGGKAPATVAKSSRKLWIAVAGVIASAAVAGIVATGSAGGAAGPSATRPAAPPAATTIGAPVEISIGAP